MKGVMGRKYSSIKMPDWFDLCKYDGLESFNGEQWSDQLDARNLFFDMFVRKTLPEEIPGTANLIFEGIKIDPLNPEAIMMEDWRSRRRRSVSKKPQTVKQESENKEPRNEFLDLFFPAVRPLTMKDNCRLIDSTPTEARQVIDLYWNDHNALYELENNLFLYDKWCAYPASLGELVDREDLNSIDSIDITVDLRAPNEQIIDEFKKFISLVRKKDQFKTEKFSRSTLSQLVDAKVLPYLDLLIYAKYEGLNIPDHKMGEWLFIDDDIDVAEKIRKITKPLARKALDAIFGLKLLKIN